MDCRPSNFNDLPKEVKAKYVCSKHVPKEFMVQCDFEGLKDIRVITSDSHIQERLEGIRERGVKMTYLHALKLMVEYSQKDTDKIYKKQGKIWQNMCEDIVIYYCCRVLLFKKPIPIVKM
jgi:hypothetical protein